MKDFKIGSRVKLITRKGVYVKGVSGVVTYFLDDGRISVKVDEEENAMLVCLPTDICLYDEYDKTCLLNDLSEVLTQHNANIIICSSPITKDQSMGIVYPNGCVRYSGFPFINSNNIFNYDKE